MTGQLQWIGNLITAVATISGVLIGQALARRTERTKARREDATRWLQDRREAYAEFLAAVWPMRGVSTYAGICELGDPHHPTIDQRRLDVATKHELIYLIAPADVIKQADRVRGALFELFEDSHSKFDAVGVIDPGTVTTGGHDNQWPLIEAVFEAAIAFREAARRDLGIEAEPAEAAEVTK
ncbi:hypothetical protein HUO13_02435 [Saccharopolyspora erythraea]|uniref:hypothetical protein n=1 Tax=Saccharopolyspora erythraea TaxID=1836 RepID=UPI001BAA4E0E|nr:hypothetical protein [Saccharopolyspora erythraea]QUG99809.1 hypothetical protein HUO13_02435 [Saccharopolyspora erythraea]